MNNKDLKMEEKEVVMDITDERTGVSVTAVTDESGTYFFHPLTGSRCTTIDQAVLHGWSEQDEELNRGWSRIVSYVNWNTDDIWEYITNGANFIIKGDKK